MEVFLPVATRVVRQCCPDVCLHLVWSDW